jgi:predicted acyl esterase
MRRKCRLKLIDVYPDGRAYNLDETIQRMRYREGYDRQVFMEAGSVYRVVTTTTPAAWSRTIACTTRRSIRHR